MPELYKMCSSWKFLILLTIYVSGQDPAVVLPQGRIAGIKVYPKNSIIPVEIYFGVPFAIPPTGRYRFSAPERHPGWRRTFFAHRRPPRCPQFGDTENDSVSEDCLFLNIWTPQRADKKSLPVVVILYSESWSNGGATSLPCEEIASDGVVVVTVSYRLHMLGFFTMKSILARGNLAILDQYLALLWIRENIAAFGGDPTSITLMGHSFGADCVLHHIVSRRAIGLFQRAIIMSPRYIWQAIDDENVEMDIVKISKEFARGIGCSGSDEEIVHCLRDRPFADILRTYRNLNWTNAILPIPDTFLPESEQYLPRSLAAALSATKQPTTQLDLLLGTTDLEAINFDHVDYEELSRRGASYIIEYATNKGIPELFRMLSMSPDIHPMLVEAVRWEFWGPKGRVQNANVESLRAAEALARADSSVKWGVGAALLAARLTRRFSRLYVYRFTQPSGVDLRGHQLNYTGAVHGTDLVALLGDAMLLQVARRPATVDEQRTSTQFRRYIVNFAKFGSPEIEQEWPRYKAGEAYVQNIRDNVDLWDHIAERHVAFWLQYLPHLTSTVSLSEGTEQLHLTAGETRLRGGVFALCGIMLVLLALLCACAVLLRWERARRHSTEATD